MITTNQPVSKYTAFGFLDQTSARTKSTSSQDVDSFKLQLSIEDCDEIEEVATDEFVHVKIVTTPDFLFSSDSTGALSLSYNYECI